MSRLQILGAAALALGWTGAAQAAGPGYTNTPVLPDGKWRVHDSRRPQPRVIKPGTASTQEKTGKPPSDAIVLFDGKNLDEWNNKKWKLENGYMEAVRKAGTITSKRQFGDIQLHIEWAAPNPPKGSSQGRGNSGVFLMGKYEIQVLDCYNNKTYPDGQTASLYGQKPPFVNACRPPGQWQMYDIFFQAPRFDRRTKKLIKPGYVTLIHNGVLMHHHQELLGPTRHKKVAQYSYHPPKGPVGMQDHGNPIRYRNIWVRELKGYDYVPGKKTADAGSTARKTRKDLDEF